MATHGFDDNKNLVDVYAKSETYAKSEVYAKADVNYLLSKGSVLKSIGTFNASSTKNCAQYESTDITGTITIPTGVDSIIIAPMYMYGFIQNTATTFPTYVEPGTADFKANVTNVNKDSRVPALTYAVYYFGKP